MADGLNRVLLIGNIGQDPELRHTQNSCVLNIRMATSESWLNESKQRQEKTEWHTVVVWGKRGEGLSKHLCKGDRIAVEGKLQTRSWETDDGTKRYATEIVASNVVFCGNARGNGDAAGKAKPKGNDPNYPPDDQIPPVGDDFPF